MNRNQKLIWMFTPLAFAFGMIFMAMDDVRHPVTLSDTCMVIGTGPAVARLKKDDNILYRQSNTDLYDVALQCQKRGIVVLNDHEPFENPLAGGIPVKITSKQYQYLPTQWRVDVQTGNPDE